MKIGQVIRVSCGVFLILAGSLLYLYPNVREARTQREVDTIMEEFEELHEELIKDDLVKEEPKQDSQTQDSEKEEVSGHLADIRNEVYPELYKSLEEYNEMLRGRQVIEDAWAYKNSSVDISVLGSDTIGYIEIPDMKVRLPLYLGSSETNLAKGAAVVNGTSMPIGGEGTHCVIAGHRGWRGSAYFQFIENMGLGSKVYVHTPWERMVYQTVDVRIVKPSETESILIQEGRDLLTLVSCHPYVLGGGPERYLVYCERVTEEDSSVPEETPTQKEDVGDTSKESEQTEVEDRLPQKPKEEDKLLVWETRLRKYLPPITLILCGVLIFFRTFRRKQ